MHIFKSTFNPSKEFTEITRHKKKYKKQQVFGLCRNVNLNLLGLDHIVYSLTLTAWVVKCLKYHESIRAASQPGLLGSPGWSGCGQQDAVAQRGEHSAVYRGAGEQQNQILPHCRSSNEVRIRNQARSEGTALFSHTMSL